MATKAAALLLRQVPTHTGTASAVFRPSKGVNAQKIPSAAPPAHRASEKPALSLSRSVRLVNESLEKEWSFQRNELYLPSLHIPNGSPVIPPPGT